MESIPFEAGEAEESQLGVVGSNVHHSEKPLRDRFTDTSRKSQEVPVRGQDLMFAGLSNRTIHPEPQEKSAAAREIHLDHSLTLEDRQLIVSRALNTDQQDAEDYLHRSRARFDRVDLGLPTVEVRVEDLHIETEVYAETDRQLPSLYNAVRSSVEYVLIRLHIMRMKKIRMAILNHVSTVLKPGRLTLVLGPPGGGKSSLLKAMAGKLSHHGLQVGGKVSYNGHELHEFLPERTAVYVEQEDQHMPELTVRETLDFSARCQGVGSNAELLAELKRREKEMGLEVDWAVDAMMKANTIEGAEHSVSTEFIIKMLGLDICADTIVGNAMKRGVSGGQKKRVTSAEMIVGPKRVLFMDEISTGLDSSTTFAIIKYLRDITHMMQYTTAVALLQPAPETYDLFDDIMLIAEGYMVYHGPRENVLDFFEPLGFRCPERKGIADFLQEVTSRKDQQQYWHDASKPYRFISVAEFAEHFKNFSVGRQIAKDLASPPPTCGLGGTGRNDPDGVLVRKRYALSSWELFKACWRRELILVSRNAFLYGFRFFVTMLMAIVTATLFLRTNLHPDSVESGNLYFSVIFFSLISLMFDGFAEETLTVQRLEGWYKQRDNKMYPAWAYVLPTTILRLPYSLTAAVLWCSIVYYPVGLAPEPGRFFTLILLLAMLHNMGISLFRFNGSLCRNENVASTGGAFLFLVLLLLGGFLLAKGDIPPWWIWFYWIDPIAYAQRAIAINEFAAPRWKALKLPTGESVGDVVLGQRQLPNEEWWIWLAVGVIAFAWALFQIGNWANHAYLDSMDSPTASLREDLREDLAREKAEKSNRGKASQKALPVSTPASTKSGPLNGHINGHANGMDVEMATPAPRKSTGSRRDLSTIIRESRGSLGSAAFPGVKEGKGMVLPFTPLSLTFHHLNYYVDLPKGLSTDPDKAGPRTVEVGGRKMLQLLNDCSGAFRPGILTALVGSSGAGKTTIMDVLAGRKTTGKIEGDVRVSGYPKVQETFARIMGYVEQSDIHSPNITVLESLVYSARLRFGKEVERNVVYAFVQEVMELVELESLCQALVGKPGLSGLSVEQRKRLTIAVELVANPSIIFMDEPTSGLDARAAAIVMRTVRNTVNTGRTVVCTIHQPSIDIFEAFDDLLLLKSGGNVIYHGSLGKNSSRLISYFEAIPNVPKLTEGLNPATWMLQVSTPGMESTIGVDFGQIYRSSELYKQNEALIEELSIPPPGSQPLHFETKYAQNALSQFRLIFWKFWQSYLRDVPYNGTRFIFATVLAVLFGLILLNVNHKKDTIQDVGNILGSLYLSMLFLGIINSRTVQPVAANERAVMYRERAAGMYSELPFASAQCLIEVPYNLLQSLIFSCISYFMLGFDHTAAKFFWYVLVIFLTLNLMTFYGVMAVYVTPDLAFGSVISGFFYSFWNLFAGFLIGVNQMVPWWKWYWYINPISWTLYGIIVTQLGDDNTVVDIPGGGSTTISGYLDSTYNYQLSWIGNIIGILIGFMVFFGALAILSLKFINYQRR
ncbi:Pleiotropic drug resistance protein 1 [Coccomyxa sp. Obi]|nr:Pleiotropic drug resistance protein 1 [Coccomyxa sp. Obi]